MNNTEPTTPSDSDHDAALLAMRPIIPAVEALLSTPALVPESLEWMHHACLRPVLKMQHKHLLMLAAAYVQAYSTTFSKMNGTQKRAFILQAFKKEPALRNCIIGLVIGCFAEQELRFYLRNTETRAELNKRIIEMATNRVNSDVATLEAFISNYQ
jgi:hypothetical protein